MDVETAIRTRRTHKAYRPEPVDRETLDELFELARWAPNHHLTSPWRFRVVGPEALERLKAGRRARGGAEARPRADARRLLVQRSAGDPSRTRRTSRDRLSPPTSSCSPRTRAGLAGYWRTPAVLRTPEGRAAVGLADDERFVGLLHLGRPVQEQRAARARARRRHASPTSTDGRRCSRAQTHSRRSTAERFDVVVIGGGVTGAGVALDAASRGYSVALVERDDWAFGTSSRSSKMVHGGLRYLQNFDLGLVREALLERQLMVQLAPHLVYPTPFLVPTLGDDRRDRRSGSG